MAARPAAQRAEGDGGIGRAVDGGAGLRDGFAREFRHDGKAKDVGGFALIGGHAEGGVALQVFDRGKVFLLGQFDVFDGDIVLLIQPGAALAFVDVPEGGDADRGVFGLWQVGGVGRQAEGVEGGVGLGGPCGEGGVGGHGTRRGTGGGQASGAIRAGGEGGECVIPDRAATVVAGDVDVGVPAARDAQRVDGEGFRLAVRMADGDGFQAKAALAINHLRALEVTDAGQKIALLPGVDDGGDVDAFGLQVGGGAQAIVVVGEDGDAVARQSGPAVGIGAEGTGQQDTGAVVVFKADGAFDGPGGEDRAAGIDAPQDLARFAGRGGWAGGRRRVRRRNRCRGPSRPARWCGA